MDFKRIIILIPLAVFAYLMVMQWNKDYHEPHNDPQQTEAQQQGNNAASSSDNDLKGPSSTADSQSMPSTDTSGSSQQGKLIDIDTDVLDLRIDPQGGDIVYAALPKQTQSLGSRAPFVLLDKSKSLNYVARSGLQIQGHQGRLNFTADNSSYKLSPDQKQLVVDLHADVNGATVTKRFTLDTGSYAVKVQYFVDNQSNQPLDARFIGQLARDQSPDPTSGHGPGMRSYFGAAYSTPNDSFQKVSLEDLANHGFANQNAKGGWVAMVQHYFVSAWVPESGQTNTYFSEKDGQGLSVAAFAGPQQQIAAGNKGELSATLYVGPKIRKQLLATAPNLQLSVDYGWLWFLATPLFYLLSWIHSAVGNWGWSIVLLTCVVKIILLPLSAKAYKSMAKMRKMKPQMDRLREQYGDDRQKMSQEMMKFYQKEKINPLGGCLPMVIQMPVFISLYWMLSESVELRHSPFILWVHDLSAMDPYFILPILMGLSMFFQQQLNPTPPDPTQAKMMKMLPIIFFFFFLWFPAGLVLYWITNNVLSIAQQYFITKQIEKGDAKREAKAK